MSTNAEITYAIQNDRPSIMIRVSVQEEGNSTPDLCGMLCSIQEAITEFQKTPQAKLLSSTEVVVQEASSPSPPVQQNSSPESSKSDPTKMISSKQMNLLMRQLRENGTSVEALCQANGVSRIQDLTMARAREIIHDLSGF